MLYGSMDEDAMLMVEAVHFFVIIPQKTSLLQVAWFRKAAKLLFASLKECNTEILLVEHASLRSLMAVKVQEA